jgi:hypothetical protein
MTVRTVSFGPGLSGAHFARGCIFLRLGAGPAAQHRKLAAWAKFNVAQLLLHTVTAACGEEILQLSLARDEWGLGEALQPASALSLAPQSKAVAPTAAAPLKGGAAAQCLSTDHCVRGGAAAAQAVACAAGSAGGPGADAAQVALDAAQVALDAAEAVAESRSMTQVAAQAATLSLSPDVQIQPGSAKQSPNLAAAADYWLALAVVASAPSP